MSDNSSQPSAEATPELPPFQLARGLVVAVDRVSPSFARVTFSGPELVDFGTPGGTFDQRIKLVFPPASGVLPDVSRAGADWYRAWLDVPEGERGSMRTYSIREVREVAEASGAEGAADTTRSQGSLRTEVVIDFVLHLEPGLTGPASLWASSAQVGDELILVGPRRGRTDGGGIEFDQGEADCVLLAGDETAAPAIARILEDAPDTLKGAVFIEVPEAADQLEINAPAGVEVHWIARDDAAHGTLLIPAVSEYLGDVGCRVRAPRATAELDPSLNEAPLTDTIDIRDIESEQLLWETPQYSGLGEELGADTTPHAGRYFWIAGESGVVTTLRRHLVKTLGIDRTQVAFMGYWRRGVAMKG